MDELVIKRQEIKYYINYLDYINLSRKISNVLQRDFHDSGPDGYKVRSLYFDNKSNNSYFEKISGVESRKKIRIRVYNNSNSIIKMEIKNKKNATIIKESFLLNNEDLSDLSKGCYDCLLKYDNKIAKKLYYEFSKDYYKPVIVIDYIREAYNYSINNVRITFDKKILKNEFDFAEIFSQDLEMHPVIDNRRIILEIKYDDFVPSWIKDLLQVSRFERCAISKYTLSRYFEK
jgi:hypothetical protein